MSSTTPQKKFKGNEILRDLIPLNSLTKSRFREVSGNLSIEDVSAGSYLFGEGDRDNRSIYLLDGVINFLDASGRVTGVVSAGTDPARYPIANQQPRITTARTATKSVVAIIDSTLLDVMLTLDQSATTGMPNLCTDTGEDWMTRVLQSDAFIKLPPTDIQRLLQTLQSVTVNAGDTVIRQGDEGDYFYIISKGSCSVTRLASGEGWDVPLAELGKGDFFGEEALVSDATRNATVTMLTDGTLMRLSKKDFVELLKKPLVHHIDYELATAVIKDGGIWLDVRLPDEHSNHAFENSKNVPLASIRDKASTLTTNKKYVIYCDTGRRSAAAAFLLSQRGLDVCVLEGGLNTGLPAGVFGLTLDMPVDASPEPAAEVLSLVEPDEATVTGDQGTDLQTALSALETEFTAYDKVVKQMQAACTEEEQARVALSQKLDQLKSLVASAASKK
ncbi:MAG TPA: cyclic nucleotide-binding domain-containing protein [Halieaceae bacterium]|nr:cyclic nucleotide-binding domain-containing protein [Halieaceae bacterium]